MNFVIRLFLGVLAIVLGGGIGLLLGLGFAAGLGMFSQWQHPEDPSAGSVAIVAIATGPLGAILGAITAAVVAGRASPKASTPTESQHQ